MKFMNNKSFGIVLTAIGFILGIYGFINLIPYGWILTLLGVVAIVYGGSIREESKELPEKKNSKNKTSSKNK